MSAATATATSNPTPTRLGSKISAVTVYRSGASIVREASLPTLETGAEGPASLRFDDLPLGLVDSSLRCRVIGAPGVRATEVRCELRLPDARDGGASSRSEERKALAVKVEQLQARLAFVQEELAQKLTLGDRGKPGEGEAPMKSPLLARVETLRVLGERTQRLHAELETLAEELRVTEIALDELVTAEDMQTTDRQARVGELRKSVVVALQGAEHAARGRIELEYFVPGARWAPSYALRLGADLREGALAMRAMVSQRSGEDWKGVNLTLSTADHQRWAEIPDLDSKRIGRRQPKPPQKGWRAAPVGTDLLYRDYDASFGGPSSSAPIGGFTPQPGRGYSAEAKEEYERDEQTPLFEIASNMLMDDLDEEFEDESTSVMPSAAYEQFAASEAPPLPQAPMPAMASFSAQEAPPPGAPMKKAMVGRSRSAAAPGGFGGGGTVRRPAPAKPSAPQVDLEVMQYARLRMEGPGTRSRGSLRVCTRLEVYAELFVEQGETLDPYVHTHLEQAHYSAEDIAAMPTGHSEPWAEEFDYAYRSENTVDLDSDGQFHSLPIATAKASCAPLHVVVPRESTDVFRTVKVDNPMDAPLLAGPMDVYWDDAFLLTSSVAFTAPKGKVELGLGVDQAVKVVRNTHYREDTAGLIGGSLELTHKIVIEVANEGGHEIALEVRERVPVAAKEEDDIKLEVKNVSPSWTAYEPKAKDAGTKAPKGVYRWQVPLTAGERKELSATYEIKMPSKYELQGGNRREW